MFDNKLACIGPTMDALLEALIQEANLVEAVDEDNDIATIQGDLNDVINDEDVKLPDEMSEYFNTLGSQTQQLENELAECDELLLYCPHQSKGPSQALVLYEDLKELEQAAAGHGMSVEEFKQKVLSEIDQEGFNEEDVNREFEEFAQLQKELEEIRSAVRHERKETEIKAIMAPDVGSGNDTTDNVDSSEISALAIGDGTDDSRAAVEYQQVNSSDSGNDKVGPLASFTDFSRMRDYVLDQLQKTEELHKIKTENLVKFIEICKLEEEKKMLEQEKWRQKMLKVQMKEEAVMMEKVKEKERLEEEEQKIRDEDLMQELSATQAEIEQLSEALVKEKHQYEVSYKQLMDRLSTVRQQAAITIQKMYRGHRTRKKNASIIEELKKWKDMKKEGKFNLRVMEVEYEIQYQEEQAKREKEEKEKSALEEKKRKEEEERQKEIEKRKREMEERIKDEIRREIEKKKEEERLEEKRKQEAEIIRKEKERKQKEEEKLMKEEEIKRKNEEKRIKQEEVKRIKQEEEKHKSKEKKNIKEKEKRKKTEEKKGKEDENLLLEEERRKQEDIIKLKDQEEKKKIKEENRKEVEEKFKINETELKVQEKSNNEVIQKHNKENNDNGRKIDSAKMAEKNERIETLNKKLLISLEKESNVSSQAEADVKTLSSSQASCSITQQPIQAASVSMENPSPHHLNKSLLSRQDKAADSPLVQTSGTGVITSVPQGCSNPLTMKEDLIELKRLNWMKTCIPWSKVSCEPWKLKQTCQKSHRKPPQAKRIPPVAESVILETAQANSMREVCSLSLCDLSICSLSSLGQCWSLRYLTVTRCGLICLDGLSQCKHLLYINVENNNVEYMDLKELGNLQVVRLAHNNLTGIHGLEGCINLRWLDLSYNRITRISGLGSLRRIHTLNLSHNQLMSSEGLEEAITLQHVDLSHNYLQHLSDITKLCLLSHLDLSSNNLLEVPELKNQVLLLTLYLRENSLRSLEPLQTCWLPMLQTLDCSQNMLESVKGVSSLISLLFMDISLNQITDMENLLPSLGHHKQLETLLMESNPLVDVYREEYRQIIVNSIPSLKSVDHQSVNRQAANHQTVSHKTAPYVTAQDDNEISNDFIQMCFSQISLHTRLKSDYDSQMKALLTNHHVTDEILCTTYFTYCDTSFKMASEHRYSHEYGDITTSYSVSNFSLSTVCEKDTFNSSLDWKQQQTAAGQKHKSDVCFNNRPDINISTQFNNLALSADSKPNPFQHVLSGKDSNTIKTSTDSFIAQTSSLSCKGNQHSDESFEKSLTYVDVSRIPDNVADMSSSITPCLNIAHSKKMSNHSEMVLKSFNQSNSNDLHNDENYSISTMQQSNIFIQENSKFELGLTERAKSPISSPGSTSTVEQSNYNTNNPGYYGQYLSGKDKFEIALRTQTTNSKGVEDTRSTNNKLTLGNHQILYHKPYDGRTSLSGVKANVVGSQKTTLIADDVCKDLKLSAHGLDESVDLDGFDIDKFLDAEEIDELLDTGWRPEKTPIIHHGLRPKIEEVNTECKGGTNKNKENNKSQVPVLPFPSHQPSQAWMFSPDLSEQKLECSSILRKTSPVMVASPLSLASAEGTEGGGSIRSKKEELSEEWGFKDARTVETMLARAKKMKYNSERRKKLNKLDPQKRLHLLKKLEEKYRVRNIRPPSTKVLPRKEYFKAREEELQSHELEKKAEDNTRAHRMFEWLHAQVGEFHAPSSGTYRGNSPGLLNTESVAGRGEIKGIHARKVSPLSDHQRSVNSKEQLSRRYSTGETHNGHSSIFPPIQISSLPSSQKNERISFRGTPIERSAGWGGGRKRGQQK